jgi:transcriptional regulator with XRE-family HTH domain
VNEARTLGQVIRSRRIALALTQEELAERIGDGVRQAEISRLERDRVTLPRRRRLERIAAALDLSLGELLATAGWSGADGAFQSPALSAAGENASAPAQSKSLQRGDVAALTDLRQALVRSQELHWHTLQVLNASRELAAHWYAGRIRRTHS